MSGVVFTGPAERHRDTERLARERAAALGVRWPEPTVVDDLDELWRRRIIRDQGLFYDFSHDKLRAVALETISPARRRQLHRRVDGRNPGADDIESTLGPLDDGGSFR